MSSREFWMHPADKNPLGRLDIMKADAQKVRDVLASMGTYMTLQEAQEWLIARRRRLRR